MEYLVVSECLEQQFWDASVCKNTAHCVARDRFAARSRVRAEMGGATVSVPGADGRPTQKKK